MLCNVCLGARMKPVQHTEYLECPRCNNIVQKREDHCYRIQQAMLRKRQPHPVKRFWQRYQGQILGACLTAILIIGIIGWGR